MERKNENISHLSVSPPSSRTCLPDISLCFYLDKENIFPSKATLGWFWSEGSIGFLLLLLLLLEFHSNVNFWTWPPCDRLGPLWLVSTSPGRQLTPALISVILPSFLSASHSYCLSCCWQFPWEVAGMPCPCRAWHMICHCNTACCLLCFSLNLPCVCGSLRSSRWFCQDSFFVDILYALSVL